MTPAEQRASLAQAEEFLAELGRGIPTTERVMAGYASEATVQTDKSGKKLNAGWWPVPYAAGKHIDQAKNCYACISSSVKTPNPKTGELRYWRGEASFGHGLALMVDDIGVGKGSKGELTIQEVIDKLAPTAIVETSPDNFQLWYFFKEPEPHMLKFKAFLVSFVAKVLGKGGDNTIRDVSRYGRMPTGVNNKRTADGKLKYDDGCGKPFHVNVNHANYKLRYTIDQIAEAFGFAVVVPEPNPKREDPDADESDAVWLEMAQKAMSGRGEGSGGRITENMSGKFRIQCPWGHLHTNGDPGGAYFRGPIPGADVDYVFGCAHDTCRKEGETPGSRKRTWTNFVDEVVMPLVEASCEKANQRAMVNSRIPLQYSPLLRAFVEHFNKEGIHAEVLEKV